MKQTLISALVLSITLAGAIAPMSQAENPPVPPAQMQFEDGVPIPPGLNLTAAQKERLKAIHASFRDRLDGILTTEQRQSLEAAKQAGKTPPEAMESLNLSEEQKEQLQAEMKSMKSQLDSVLTPEQKQKLRQLRQQQGGEPFSFLQR